MATPGKRVEVCGGGANVCIKWRAGGAYKSSCKDRLIVVGKKINKKLINIRAVVGHESVVTHGRLLLCTAGRGQVRMHMISYYAGRTKALIRATGQKR